MGLVEFQANERMGFANFILFLINSLNIKNTHVHNEVLINAKFLSQATSSHWLNSVDCWNKPNFEDQNTYNYVVMWRGELWIICSHAIWLLRALFAIEKKDIY